VRAETAFPKWLLAFQRPALQRIVLLIFLVITQPTFPPALPRRGKLRGRNGIFNIHIGIANQNANRNINYFALLDKQKINYDSLVTCCCGVGQNVWQPAGVHLFDQPGALYVDLFTASEFRWEREAGMVKIAMETAMPLMAR